MSVYVESDKKEGRRIYWGELLDWYKANPEELIGKTVSDIIEDIVTVVIVAEFDASNAQRTGYEGEPLQPLTLSDLLENSADYGINLTKEENALATIIREGQFSELSGPAFYKYGAADAVTIPDLHTVIYNAFRKVDEATSNAMGDELYNQEILNFDTSELLMLYQIFEDSDQKESAVNALVVDSEITGLTAQDFLSFEATAEGQVASEYYGLSEGYVIGKDGVFVSAYDLESDPITDRAGNIVNAVFKLGDADKLALELSASQIKELHDFMILIDREQYAPLIENEGRLSSNNVEITFLALLMSEANNSVLANALNPDMYDNLVTDYNSDFSHWDNLGFGSNKKGVVKSLIDKKTEIDEIDTLSGAGTPYWKKRSYNLVNPSEVEMEAELSSYFNKLGLTMTSSDAVRFGKYLLETRQKEARREAEIDKQIDLFQSVLPSEEKLATVTEPPKIEDFEDKSLYVKALAEYEEYKTAVEEERIRTTSTGLQYISATEEYLREKYNQPKLETYNAELEFNKILETELAGRIGAVNTNNGLRTAAAKFQNRFMNAQNYLTGGGVNT
tara:strand:- start:3605 stop:5293 length:1689 start_codon:yes stop_codon:yes gene_type:complete